MIYARKVIMTTDIYQIHQEFSLAGEQLTNLGAAEASSGNLSIFVRNLTDFSSFFSKEIEIPLPVKAPSLRNGWVIITASGSRLRDIKTSIQSTLCLVKINLDGKTGVLFSNNHFSPSSEWNTHLAIHNDQVASNNLDFHAIVHAQPFYLTYLSHLSEYSSEISLNQKLLRWQPETILTFPEGIGTIPFIIPGSVQLMEASLSASRPNKLFIWQKHGVIARSTKGLVAAVDLVEYAETAAKYETLNLQNPNKSAGLTYSELQNICYSRGIKSSILEKMTD